MPTSCIIVEDEPLAMERAKQYVQSVSVLTLLATFANAIDAWVYLKNNTVDLIFLDINLGEMSGIQLLETGNINSQVIITTAYPDYALKGFDLKVTDYLLKPYTFERFLQAVDRVQTHLRLPEHADNRPFIFIKTENRLEKVMLDNIFYIEGMRDYRKIHTSEKKIMTLKTFVEFEQEVAPAIIYRIHKSYMVNLSKITTIEKDGVNVNGSFLPVSDTYKRNFLEYIKKGDRR